MWSSSCGLRTKKCECWVRGPSLEIPWTLLDVADSLLSSLNAKTTTTTKTKTRKTKSKTRTKMIPSESYLSLPSKFLTFSSELGFFGFYAKKTAFSLGAHSIYIIQQRWLDTWLYIRLLYTTIYSFPSVALGSLLIYLPICLPNLVCFLTNLFDFCSSDLNLLLIYHAIFGPSFDGLYFAKLSLPLVWKSLFKFFIVFAAFAITNYVFGVVLFDFTVNLPGATNDFTHYFDGVLIPLLLSFNSWWYVL